MSSLAYQAQWCHPYLTACKKRERNTYLVLYAQSINYCTNHSKTHFQHSHIKQCWMMVPKLPLVYFPHNTVPLYCCNLFSWPVSHTFIDLPLLFCITFFPLPSPTVYFHTLEPCSLRAFFYTFPCAIVLSQLYSHRNNNCWLPLVRVIILSYKCEQYSLIFTA